jgi:5'-3' exonuclease
MGIPFYFVSLIKKHKGIVSKVRVKLEPDILAIDFNCLIHTYIDNKNPIESVIVALEKIIKETCSPRKKLYVAMDGVVPYAKIVQQRYRRFRKNTEVSEFDRHQISPGTPYMKELASAVQHKFPHAIISSTAEEGEGEHKIFQWLKSLSKEERRSVCIYGLDADLILLSLAQRGLALPRSFWLLRENQTFGDKETPGFSILNIGGFELDMPIEQYIMLSTMCFGNDFVPALGFFSLREGGYERGLHIYKQSGNPDLLTAAGRRQFLQVAGSQEFNLYREKVTERGNYSFERAVVVPDGSHFERRYNLHVQDGVQDVSKVVEAYWKIVHWTHTYFTQNNHLNWEIYYPYPEAPLISQLLQHSEPSIQWNETPKFTITSQLQFILPKKSIHGAKKLSKFPDEFYDEETQTRFPWMRRYTWEAEPRISLPSEDLTSVQPYLF